MWRCSSSDPSSEAETMKWEMALGHSEVSCRSDRHLPAAGLNRKASGWKSVASTSLQPVHVQLSQWGIRYSMMSQPAGARNWLRRECSFLEMEIESRQEENDLGDSAGGG